MKGLIARTASAAMALPTYVLKSLRGYAPLAGIRAMPAPSMLLVASHWIGDTLWAAQVVPHLRRRWPEAHLAALTKPFSIPLWSGALAVDRVIPSCVVTSDRRRERHSWKELIGLSRSLAPESWDLVIDLTGNRYSAVFCHALRARHTLGFDGGACRGLYASRVEHTGRAGVHLAERPFRVVEPLLGAFAYDGQVLPPEPSLGYEEVCLKHGLDPHRPLAIIAPGAGWPEKRWPPEHFATVAEVLSGKGCQIVLTGAVQEVGLSHGIAQRLAEHKPRPAVLIHNRTLDDIMALMRGCTVFLGNDSGLAHIAAAMGSEVRVIFTGVTDPATCRPIGRLVELFLVSGSASVDKVMLSLPSCISVNRNDE